MTAQDRLTFALQHVSPSDYPAFSRKNDNTLKFPEKLMLLLVHLEHLSVHSGNRNTPVIWGPQGDVFIVRDEKALRECWIPQFFGPTKYTSFTRKLYRWGFHKINPTLYGYDRQSGTVVFGNPDFHRDHKQRVFSMESRTAAKMRRQAKSSSKKDAAATVASPSPKSPVEADSRVARVSSTVDASHSPIRLSLPDLQNNPSATTSPTKVAPSSLLALRASSMAPVATMNNGLDVLPRIQNQHHPFAHQQTSQQQGFEDNAISLRRLILQRQVGGGSSNNLSICDTVDNNLNGYQSLQRELLIAERRRLSTLEAIMRLQLSQQQE